MRRVIDSVREEVADRCRDLRSMGLKGEVARVEEMYLGVGNVVSERLGPLRQEEGIVLSPYGGIRTRRPIAFSVASKRQQIPVASCGVLRIGKATHLSMITRK